MDDEGAVAPRVLDNKRDASKYRVLVEIAARQPAVSQGEIADVLGVTSQAVSDYVRELVDRGYVEKRGRGRYEVTKEGVDWLITRTDALSEFVSRVSEDVLGSVDVDAAIAADPISEGDEVRLTMRDGVLHAVAERGGGNRHRGEDRDRGENRREETSVDETSPPNEDGSDDGDAPATAVAVTDGAAGEAVGVTEFEGVVEYDPGVVTVIPVPVVTEGDPPSVEVVTDRVNEEGFVAIAGTEAYALATRAGIRPEIRFGTVDAVPQAALRGLDVLLLVSSDELSRHTTQLRESGVRYEVHDPVGDSP
jgi:putative transcriptional regulator